MHSLDDNLFTTFLEKICGLCILYPCNTSQGYQSLVIASSVYAFDLRGMMMIFSRAYLQSLAILLDVY